MKANETYRNDPVLRTIIIDLIEKELDTYKESLPFLQKIYDNTSSLDRVEVWSLIDRTKWYIKFFEGVLEGEKNGTSAYVGNQAAFLTKHDAERMKAGIKYDKLP